jgi:hypothetical protein
LPGASSRNLFSELGFVTLVEEIGRIADQGAAGSPDRHRKRTKRQTSQTTDQSSGGCPAMSFFGDLLY